MNITDWPAASLSEAIHARDVSCREVMAAYLDRIDEQNPAVNAIVSLRDRDELMAEAATCDDELAHDLSRGWMHGMPQAIKDLNETRGIPTTKGSPLLQHWVPEHDCLMVSRMKAAGCIVVGKTNVPEFGLGSHTFNSVFGTTRNPFDLSRTAGGSSGGAAVALATRMLPVADGSDFMGSLRNPAAWNNIFGFRPSRGRVPAWPLRDGFLAQMGVDGPMGRTVLDMAMLLGTQAGYDRRDPLSLSGRLDEFDTVAGARNALAGGLGGTRVGWLGDLDGYLATEPGVLDLCVDALRVFATMGSHVEPVLFGMPPAQVWEAWLVWRHYLVAAALAPLAANAAKRELVKPEALWELDLGMALNPSQLMNAAIDRTSFHTAVTDLFTRFDVLVLPTAQVWPFEASERWPQHIGDREMDTYHRWMEVTTYATFAGLPAVNVPVGFDDRGLPMGMQLIGPPRGDAELLRIAAAYETTLDGTGMPAS
ncbi:MAG: amidase [Actinomycetota bacterium]|nr:amidase [Actinomycetota bacterium]